MKHVIKIDCYAYAYELFIDLMVISEYAALTPNLWYGSSLIQI